MGTAQMRVIDQ